MKVLFLDIDGVLNSANWLKKNEARLVDKPDLVLCEVDPEAVKLLNEILDRTGAKVVVSSSWRLRDPLPEYRTMLDEIRAVLGAAGFTGEIIGQTPLLMGTKWGDPHVERGHEVLDWLEGHPEVTAYACLDDGNDFSACRSHLCRTHWKTGLRGNQVVHAVQLLGEVK